MDINVERLISLSNYGFKIIDANQGGRGHYAVYYTIPQSFTITFSYSMA